MRPVAKRQSAFRYPLSFILGTEANVRVLRALAFSSAPRSHAELARETGLSAPGLRRSVVSLEEAGVVDLLGAARRQRVRLRREHPLSAALVALFQAEADRPRQVPDQLRAAFESLDTAPISVWIAGPVAEGTDELADQLVVCILANAADVDMIRQSVEPAIEEIEGVHDLLIELRIVTRADLKTLSQRARDQLARVLAVLGPAPSALIKGAASPRSRRTSIPRSHAEHDIRSRAMGAAIAEAIKRDPSLIERAHSYIVNRQNRASRSEQRELQEWGRILRTASPAKLRKLLVDPGERATRLRQTLPFLDALTPGERDAVYASLEDDEPGDDQ